jgi:amidase
MAIGPPTDAEIEDIARDFGMHLDREDVASFKQLAAPFVLGTAALDAIDDDAPGFPDSASDSRDSRSSELRYPRSAGYRPEADENPLGAWYVKTEVAGASSGKLLGKSVVLKDNVMLAGVPMMNGTRLLEGYVPPVDATIATRILDAGGTIVGKAVCESFCLSGGSHTSDTGPVRNPHDPSRHAGGSSSGSAVLVATGEADLAIGCDQGGSIRMPSSFCGTVGMKATHGLVPYTGILSMDATIDHVGPITANVADNALLLEVLAGADGLDSRQRDVQVDDYTQNLGSGVEGLRMAVLSEGFGQPGFEPEVDSAVHVAASRFAKLGAKVGEVSIPEHRSAGTLLGPVFQSAFVQMFYTEGMGVGSEDPRVPSLAEQVRSMRDRGDELPDTVKTLLFGTEIIRRRYGWKYYAKAMNQVRRIRALYDRQLQDVDILLLPTTPMTAPELPLPGAGRSERVAAAFAPTSNTQPFNLTHHPALSIPCGTRAGLPIGLMLVGRPWSEAALYRAAQAFEQSSDV